MNIDQNSLLEKLILMLTLIKFSTNRLNFWSQNWVQMNRRMLKG